ncbi:MAG TPA: hypothetical protein VIK61_20685, partial [Acidimicrobiia bacterium]
MPEGDTIHRSAAALHAALAGKRLVSFELRRNVALARLRRLDPATEIGVALLDQRVAAGIGNVYKSEICWIERVSPFAPVGALDDALHRRLFAAAHRLLRANRDSSRRVTYEGGLAVYGRAGRPCPRCRTVLQRR